MFEHGSPHKKVLLIISGLLLLGGAVAFVWTKTSRQSEQIFCTQEAKLCPDGSAVGRQGPDCEFAPCPDAPTSIPAGTEDWSVTTDLLTAVTLRYPDSLPTKYIHAIDWPPRVQVVNEPYDCTETGRAIESGGQTQERTINNQSYCVTELVEGAAGSMYTQYTYAVGRAEQTIILSFSLKSVQCANYNDPEKTTCDQERASFNIDETVDLIAQSIRLE